MGKFVKEATAAGLPEDVGKRRYYAHEITRQDAVKTVLAKREEKIHDDAKEKWQRANAKVDIVRQMFDTIDDDGNGTLEFSEFTLLCKSLGLKLRPDEMQKAFDEMDEDKGGTIDFDEFQTFYYALTDGEDDGAGRRMGKEMLANLHANMFNQAIQDAKSKMGQAMMKEQARFQEAVRRMEEEEAAKDRESPRPVLALALALAMYPDRTPPVCRSTGATKRVEALRKQFNEEKKAREAERLRIYDQAVKDGFSRSVAKEKAKALAEDKARKDLVIELKEAEEEAKRRAANFAEVQEFELARLQKQDEKRKAKKRAKDEASARALAARAARLEQLEEEESKRLEAVKEQNDRISERNRQKAVKRAQRLAKLKKDTLAETYAQQDAFKIKLEALDTRLRGAEDDRVNKISARTEAFRAKQAEIKAMEEAAEEERLNLAWQAQTSMLDADSRRLCELTLKAEESKLWLQTRKAKVDRANKRKSMRQAEDKAKIQVRPYPLPPSRPLDSISNMGV